MMSFNSLYPKDTAGGGGLVTAIPSVYTVRIAVTNPLCPAVKVGMFASSSKKG